MDKKKKWKSCLIEAVIMTLFLLIIAAIAIPDFIKMLAKSRPSEAKMNFGAIFTGQVSYKGEHGMFAQSPDLFAKIGWKPEGQNHYSFYCGEDVISCHPYQCGQTPHPVLGPDWPYSIRPAAFNQAYLCMAVGNLDDDPTLDVWTINEKKELVNLVNDIKQ